MIFSSKQKGFSQKEKLEHYTGICNGEIPTKSDSKFTDIEQKAYARGQRDARNEQRRIFAAKNSTPEEKEAYRLRKAKAHVEWLEKQSKKQFKKK